MYKRLSLQATLPLVLFEPNHLLLLNGSPDRRREYLDDLLEHVRPGYAALRRKYKRTLAQRNALLKKGYEAAEGQLFPWNVRLSELGGNIAKSRNELVDTIDRAIAPLYKDLSRTKAKVGIAYQPQFPIENYETSLLKKLEASALLDSQRGFTAAGPHREDFLTMLGGKPSGETASRGEVRTCILALKIIELDIIEKARGAKPILLLDDVFSELDGARRRALTEHLQPHQTFITTTDADVVAKHFTEHSNIIPIGNQSSR
jgi:DNA replication and repair protein RecF